MRRRRALERGAHRLRADLAGSVRLPLVDTCHVTSLGGPVEMLVILFVAFKVVQIAVFVGWHLGAGDGTFWP